MANILAIAGSPSHPSRTYVIVEYATTLLQQEGFDTEIFSIRDFAARHLLGGVYAVDNQIQRQEDGSLQLDEKIDQRLKHSLRDLVEAVKQAQPKAKELVSAV